jgi:carboxyl-terminal processing protease
MNANSLKLNKNIVLLISLSFITVFTACKKGTDGPEPEVETSRAELTKDSIYLYAQQVYLWNTALPTYTAFNPRQYKSKSSDIENYEDVIFALTRYGVNPTTNKPYELNERNPNIPKYSNIDDISDNNEPIAFINTKKADVELNGSGNDLGFYWFYPYGNASNFEFYVQAVYPNSPAAKAGLTRGAIINKVNGQTVGTNYESQNMLIYNLVEDDPATVTISGFKSDGSPFTNVVLRKAAYTTTPVLNYNTFTENGKKIGYLSFISFTELEKNAKADLDKAFVKFANDGVTDLIVDLRYNGGGFVSTAQYLVNLIAPATASGTMFVEYYNETMRNNKATILTNQPLLDADDKPQYENGKLVTYADVDFSVASQSFSFSKKGPLANVANIVFLVSGATASASELVINSLKPVMNVKLIGTQTYGKPVGFFPIRLENKYDLYLSMFESRNRNNEGNYFAGFRPDVVDTETDALYDDATHNFGDARESYTQRAISLLAPGAAARTSSSTVMSIRGKKVSVSSAQQLNQVKKEPNRFVGMIENRHKLKQ